MLGDKKKSNSQGWGLTPYSKGNKGDFPYNMQGVVENFGISDSLDKRKQRNKTNARAAKDFLWELYKFNSEYRGLTDVQKAKKQSEVNALISKILRGQHV